MIVFTTLLVAFATFVGFYIIYEVYEYADRECNSCLENNSIPCNYGNCSEYKDVVSEKCPKCWVEFENTALDK